MIKNALLTFVKFLLFLAVFFWGSIKTPFNLVHVLAITRDGTHAFYWDGVVLMTILFVAILIVEAIRKRLRNSAGWTVLAFLLSLGVAVELHFMAFTR
jgi:hypothetical protein